MKLRWYGVLSAISIAIGACGETTPVDSSADASTTPDVAETDAGTIVSDAGQVEAKPDAGSVEAKPDAGPIVPDAGPVEPVPDAGMNIPDAGPETPDAGTTPEEPAPARWQPTPGTSWQIQLQGSLDTSLAVAAYDVDLFDTSTTKIASLKAQGRRVICYFSAGSYEDWRPDRDQFPASVLGEPLDGWPGENWIDIRSSAVREIMQKRLALAKQKGCDAVDPDNVDGYSNRNGLGLKASDQLDYNRFLADEAHRLGLAVGLKNDVDQIPQLVDSFDFAVNEECFEWDECDRLAPFIEQNKAVFSIEYGGAPLADRICSEANRLNFDTLVKNLDLGAARISCR